MYQNTELNDCYRTGDEDDSYGYFIKRQFPFPIEKRFYKQIYV